jgi:predicted phage terminase large subunit-like protein
VVHPSLVPQEGVVNASADLAFNMSKYRDASCYTIFKTEKKLYVLDQIAGHWKDSEKAQKIVELTQKYNINWWFIEKYPTCDRLNEDIMHEGQKQGVRVQVKWIDAKNTKDRKFHAIKSIETYLNQGVIKFQASAYTDDLFSQLENLNGTTAARKSGLDDRADSLAMGVEYFRPRFVDNQEEESEIFKEMEKERRRKEQHEMIFGGTSNYTYYKGPTQAPVDSGREIGVTRGMYGIPGLRVPAPAPRQETAERKPITFSSAPKTNR